MLACRQSYVNASVVGRSYVHGGGRGGQNQQALAGSQQEAESPSCSVLISGSIVSSVIRHNTLCENGCRQ